MTTSKIGAKAELTVPQTWKEALYASIHRSTMPLKAIADALGISRSTLEKTADEATLDNLSSKHLPALAAVIDDYTVLDYLEAKAGRLAYVLPAPGALCGVMTIAALKEFSEFLASVADAAADGSVNDADATRIEREGHQAIGAISSVMAAARAQAPKGSDDAGPTAISGRGFGGR